MRWSRGAVKVIASVIVLATLVLSSGGCQSTTSRGDPFFSSATALADPLSSGTRSERGFACRSG